MSNIVITSDSTSDLSVQLRERYNINTIPMGITLGGELFLDDGVQVTPEMIYEHHSKTGELPKTNANNYSDCYDFFKPLVDAGKTVIHFTISSEMSSTYNNARMAAEDLENVYVIDSRNLSTGIGVVMVAAAELAESGMEADELLKKINEMLPCSDASFVIDNLEYLHKGGRCSAVAAFGANLLKLKPCIQVKNGTMGVVKKYRGKYIDVLKEYVNDKLSDLSDILPDHVFVTHAGCDEEIVNSVVEQVKACNYFKNVYVTRAGCTVSSHCGRDTLGVLFIRKSPIK